MKKWQDSVSKAFFLKEKQTKLVVGLMYPNDPNFDFSKVHDYLYENGVTIYPGKNCRPSDIQDL